MEHLDERVAVVTGAASGIGRAMALRFGAAGMHVMLADIEPEPLEEAAAEVRRHGRDVSSMVCDVSDLSSVESLRAATLDAFGGVHVICNNAGVGAGGAMGEMPIADWEWVLGVNLWGVIHGIKVFLPDLVAQGEGHVVNTASVAGLFSAPFMGPYNASKFAVVSISETLHHELAFMNSEVGVSVLCPAWVRTRIHESSRNRPAVAGDGATQEATPAGGDAESDDRIAGLMAGFIESGIDPAEVADAVLAAVVHRRFYILTHDGSSDAVVRRAEAIAAGEPPPFFIPQ
ncbi:MAG: SDR family NAD(P)-dependent oxidoreductase [Acidimicrobiia bacterium]|nr:SDR family NAD(P)-dependent oxidoreductase [Acidimicrobiia bacterium]